MRPNAAEGFRSSGACSSCRKGRAASSLGDKGDGDGAAKKSEVRIGRSLPRLGGFSRGAIYSQQRQQKQQQRGFLELEVVVKKWDGKSGSRETVGAVIKHLRDGGEALTFFRWLQARNFKHDVFTYNCLLDKLIRHRDLKQAGQVFDKMVAQGVVPNGFTYAVLVQSSCYERNPDEAMRFFGEMVDKGFKPSSTLYQKVTECLVATGKEGELSRVFGRDLEKRVAVEMMLKKALLVNFVIQDKALEASKLFRGMVKSGCKPDATIYSYIVLAHCKLDNLDEAFKLFLEMAVESKAPSAKLPGLRSSALFASRARSSKLSRRAGRCKEPCKAARVDSALSLLEAMIERGYGDALDAHQRALQGRQGPRGTGVLARHGQDDQQPC